MKGGEQASGDQATSGAEARPHRIQASYFFTDAIFFKIPASELVKRMNTLKKKTGKILGSDT